MMSKLNPIQVLRATTRTVTVGSLAMLPFSVMAANSDAAIVTMLIQPKNYAEVYLAYVKPAVSAKVEAEATGTELNSDNVTPSSLAHSLTVKYAVKDDLNLVFQMDKPAAENLDYSVIDPKYPFAKSDVENNKQTVLGMLQFHVNDRIQLFGGPVYEKLSASAELNIGFETGDSSAVLTRKASGDYTFGYVAGFALSNAPTASQLSLSYNSEIEHSTAATELTSLSTFGFNTDSESVSDVEAYSPQSLTLTLQSGISQGTLAFGSIKWSDSGYTSLSTAMLNADNTDEQTVEEVPQSTKFEAGIARQINEKLFLVGSLQHQSDSSTGTKIAGIYSEGQIDLTLGFSYTKYSDERIESDEFSASFEDNSALGIGAAIGYRF